MHEIVLCADEEMLRDPSMMGLDGETLEGQSWLKSLSNANEVRGYLKERPDVDEVWVASSEDVDPINLAATLKHDCKEVKICLVAWRGSGSLMSRASAAGIDEVMGYPELARRYATMKGRARQENPRRRTPERVVAQRRAAAGSLSGAKGQPREREALPPIGNREGDVQRLNEALEAEKRSAVPEAQPMPTPSEEGARSAVTTETPSAATKRGFVLCVVSASGGVGKSTVSSLAALIAAGHGYRTVLIDADLQFGDVASMFGMDDAVSADKVIADPRLLEEATVQSGFPFIVAPPEHIEQSEVYLPQIPGLIDRARDSFDVVVVNTGSFWTESHVQMMESSTNTLFLMDQRPTSVKSVRKALDLCARCGVAAHPFLFAVNRCTRKPMLSSIDISCALNGVQVAELKEGGSVVSELMSAGMAQKLVEDRNELCLSLNDFLGQVIPDALGGMVPESAPLVEPRSKPRGKRKSFKRRGRAACL